METNELYVYEVYRIDGLGQKRIQYYILCDSFETAESILVEDYEKNHQSDNYWKVRVDESENSLTYVLYVEDKGTYVDNLVLSINPANVLNKEKVDFIIKNNAKKKETKPTEFSFESFKINDSVKLAQKVKKSGAKNITSDNRHHIRNDELQSPEALFGSRLK